MRRGGISFLPGLPDAIQSALAIQAWLLEAEKKILAQGCGDIRRNDDHSNDVHSSK